MTSLAAGTRGRDDMTGALGDQAYLAGDGASEKTLRRGGKNTQKNCTKKIFMTR